MMKLESKCKNCWITLEDNNDVQNVWHNWENPLRCVILCKQNVYGGGDRHENGREKMYELHGTVV